MLDVDRTMAPVIAHQYVTVLTEGIGLDRDALIESFIEESDDVVANPVNRDPFDVVHPSEVDMDFFTGQERFPPRIAQALINWASETYAYEWRMVETEEIEYVEAFADGMVYVESSETIGHWIYVDDGSAEIHIGAPDVIEELAYEYADQVRRTTGAVGRQGRSVSA